MKLNHDLMREMLLIVEEEKKFGESINSFEFDKHKIFKKYSREDVIYTLLKLNEGKYVDFTISMGDGIIMFYQIGNLTYEGHKFLDTIRDDNIWKDVKEETSKLKSVPIELLSQIASKIIMSNLGM